MRTVLRPLIAIAVLLSLAVPSLASAASTAAVPTRYLPASGGTIKWAVATHNAKTCTWSSSPKVAGFDETVKCTTGRVIRPATFEANTSTKVKDYMLTVTVVGKSTTVEHLNIDEAGALATTTAVTIGVEIAGGPTPIRARVTASNGTLATAGTVRYTFAVQGFQTVVSLSGTLGEYCFVQAIEGGPTLFLSSSNCTGGGSLVVGTPSTVLLSATYSGSPGYLPSTSFSVVFPL
jgi:hypothetical protein